MRVLMCGTGLVKVPPPRMKRETDKEEVEDDASLPGCQADDDFASRLRSANVGNLVGATYLVPGIPARLHAPGTHHVLVYS